MLDISDCITRYYLKIHETAESSQRLFLIVTFSLEIRDNINVDARERRARD